MDGFYALPMGVVELALTVARDARGTAIRALQDPTVPKWLSHQLADQAITSHRLLADLMAAFAAERVLPEPVTANEVLAVDELWQQERDGSTP